MIAERTIVEGTTAATLPQRPYAPSWLHRLIGRIQALPGPTWAAYVVIGVVTVVFSNAQGWASGLLPLGELAPDLTFWGIFLPALIWLVDYLDGVAGSAFDAFRPALDQPAEVVADLRYRLVVAPARSAWILTIAAAVLTPLYYVADPVASKVVGLTPAGLFLRAASEVFSSAIILIITFQLLRQMRMVNSIVASATRVDLFQPGPLYAFSKLTSRTAIALVLVLGSSSLVAAPQSTDVSVLLLWAPWIAGIPAFAAAAFVLPLRGMHARLVAEKERLQADTEARLQALLERINHDVDSGDLTRADAFNKTLATMLQQRDVVSRLPTWPWSPGTLRTIVTAILLPLGLFLAQRVLAQYL